MMYNDSYSPSQLVQQIHEIPHLNSRLQKQDSDFDITSDSYWNGYSKSLLPMPVICFCIGFLLLVTYQLILCTRCCCPNGCCSRRENRDADDPLLGGRNEPAKQWPSLRWLNIAFIVLIVVVYNYDQSLWFGSEFLSDGVSKADDALTYLDNTFTDLNTYGDDLNADGYNLQDDFNNSFYQEDCKAADSLNDYLSDYFNYIDEYLNYIQDVPDQLSDAQDSLDTYGVNYKNDTMWVFYAMFMVCMAIYAVGMCLKSKGVLFCGICAADCVVFFTFAMCTLEMIIVMLMGDYCMNPVENLLQIVPDQVYNVSKYYTTCAGGNPLQPPLTSAEDLISSGEQAINTILATSCPNDPYLQDALLEIAHINQLFANITTLIACPPNQEEILDVVNDAVCSDGIKGVYTIWLGKYVCGAALFMGSIVVAMAYPKFQKVEISDPVEGVGTSTGILRRSSQNSRSNASLETSASSSAAMAASAPPMPYMDHGTSSSSTTGGTRISSTSRTRSNNNNNQNNPSSYSENEFYYDDPDSYHSNPIVMASASAVVPEAQVLHVDSSNIDKNYGKTG